ncbi:MAG: transketolase C-terminal domain-containing protein, partial [Oscillospiraceae bacterium]
ITFASGLATTGMIPVVAVYSTFLQRAYDQVLHDAAIDGTHIVLGIDRAGVVGEDGETHQGVFDVPILTTIPNITLFSPSCYEELRLCLNEAIFKTQGVVCVRYPRGNDVSTFDKSSINADFTLSCDNSDVLLVTYGRIYDNLFSAKTILAQNGIRCDILKLTKIFPISNNISNKCKKYNDIFFFEEGMQNGGIAEHFLAKLSMTGFKGRYHILSITEFVKQATVDASLKKLKLGKYEMSEFVIKELPNGFET